VYASIGVFCIIIFNGAGLSIIFTEVQNQVVEQNIDDVVIDFC